MSLKFLSWKEGRYVDLWFFVHFMVTVFGGTLFFLLSVPRLNAWIICISVAILWEIFEWMTGLSEYLPNSLIDIATAIAGGSIGYEFIPSLGLSHPVLVYVCLVEGFIFAILTIIGWKFYKKRRIYI